LMDSDCAIDYLTVIAARKYKEDILKLLLDSGCHLIDVVYAKGGATSNYFKDMLGLLADEKKIMITCLLASNLTAQLMEQFITKLNFDKPNTGIAFTVPVDKLSI
jgi:hypothetical protein